MSDLAPCKKLYGRFQCCMDNHECSNFTCSFRSCAYEKIDNDSIKIQVSLNFHYNPLNKKIKLKFFNVGFMFAQII